MSDDLVVFVPSRGRPANAWRLGDSFLRTGAGLPRFLIDDDDPTVPWYPSSTINESGQHRIGPILNWAIGFWHLDDPRSPAFVGFMGDDHLPRTDGWADMVKDALSEPGVLAVYGDDLLQGERLATSIFVRSEAIAALGYFAPPCLGHLYIDDAWMALYGEAGALRYLPNVIIEHLHPDAGKADRDDRYRAVNSDEQNAADSFHFAEWRRSFDFLRDVETLKGLL